MTITVLVEIRLQSGAGQSEALRLAEALGVTGFELDREYEPVLMGGETAGSQQLEGLTCIVRGTVSSEGDIEALRKLPEVVEVWVDTEVAPF